MTVMRWTLGIVALLVVAATAWGNVVERPMGTWNSTSDNGNSSATLSVFATIYYDPGVGARSDLSQLRMAVTGRAAGFSDVFNDEVAMRSWVGVHLDQMRNDVTVLQEKSLEPLRQRIDTLEKDNRALSNVIDALRARLDKVEEYRSRP